MLFRSAIIEALKTGDIYHSGMPDPEDNKGKTFRDWCKKYVRPCSIDLPLGVNFWFENRRSGKRLSPNTDTDLWAVDTEASSATQFELKPGFISQSTGKPEGRVLRPKQWCLAHTEHTIGLGGNIAACVMTRTTAGRWGICVRRSAGLIDPGYRAPITLEIHNDSERGQPLYPGVCYAQIVFYVGEGEAAFYDGH